MIRRGRYSEGTERMALSVIGAGFGRTGTLSLKSALERLGFDPCYHMMEVGKNAGHAEEWLRAANGERVDWDTLFAGFHAAVDWPACSFYRAYAALYPDAKVILTLRDPDRWFDSVHNTIYPRMMNAPENVDPERRVRLTMARKLIIENTFDGRMDDRAHAIAVFERHIEEVKRVIPAERLLVFRVADGWGPLCDFLDKPVPDEPFPQVNSTEEFQLLFGS